METEVEKNPVPWPKVDVHSAPRTAKEIIVKFGLLSTVRGIPRIFKARNLFLSILWAVAVVLFLVVSLYQATLIISGFFTYASYQEQTMRLSPRDTRFPDVTICSLQPFRSHRSLKRDNVQKSETIVNGYFYNVSRKLSNASYDEYYEQELEYYISELRYYKGEKATTFTWERGDENYLYEDDAGGHAHYEYDSSDFIDQLGHDETYHSGQQTFQRSKRVVTPHHKITYPIREYVDNETITNILMSTSGLFQNIDSDLRMKLSHQRDFVDSCSYTIQNGQHLETVDCRLKIFPHPQYFNCYTIQRLDQEGMVLDLDVKLFLDDDIQLRFPKHYIHDTDAQKHGVRVVIHDAFTYPDMYTSHHDIPPGMTVTFNLHTKRWTHLPQPYGNCSVEKLVLTEGNGKKYRYVQHTCEEMCIQRKINEQCHCIDPSLITDSVTSMDPKSPDERLPYCANISSSRQILSARLACMYDFKFNPPAKCPCPVPCQRYEFTSHVDMAKWPHESFHIPLYQLTKETRNLSLKSFDDLIKMIHHSKRLLQSISNPTPSDTESIVVDQLTKLHLFQRNFVSMRVTRPNFEVHYVNDRPALDIPTLMSRIGGIMNFWLGITFITVVEFVEVMYDSILLVLKGRGRKPEGQENEKDVIHFTETKKDEEIVGL